jgi:hypothetical protein
MMYAALASAVLGAVKAGQTQSISKEAQSLRAEGPAGLEKFVEAHSKELARGDARAGEALDWICAQYDCNASRLYWYTDLEAAKARARAEHKPILSLHLLGRLDEELSCANSRFFRKLLYPDRRVSAFLREHYVLHWKTVRPVPKVTIDFGDGRVLKRTITGNSIHYVLDSDGRPIDAIPGMVAPRTFLASISAAETLAKELASLPPTRRDSLLKQWHRERFDQTLASWEGDLRKLNREVSLVSINADVRVAQLESASERLWPSIAGLHRLETELEGRAAIGPPLTAMEANKIAITKALSETPLLRQLRFLNTAVAEDSVRNEYQLHRRIHEWLSFGKYVDVERLNARVYPELFLMPLDDPWYGLKPASAYAGLDSDRS